jgi:hypothetical protein
VASSLRGSANALPPALLQLCRLETWLLQGYSLYGAAGTSLPVDRRDLVEATRLALQGSRDLRLLRCLKLRLQLMKVAFDRRLLFLFGLRGLHLALGNNLNGLEA